MNVYQRYLPDPTYYGRFTFQGKRYLRNLGTPNKEDALSNLRKIVRALEDGRFAEVEATKQRRDSAKLSALFAAYEHSALILKSVRKNNVSALRSLIRHALAGHETAESDTIDALPVTVLTAALMRNLQTNLIRAAGADNFKQDTARITANSIRRQARSLFTPNLLPAYSDLKLPDLAPFLAVRPVKEPPKLYKLPKPELVAKIRAAAPDLASTDPAKRDLNAYRIYLLALGSGLRANEIAWVRWDWIEEIPATATTPVSYQIRIQTTEDFRPKGKRLRLVPLEAAAYAQLAALRIPKLDPTEPDYILDGHKTERTKRAFQRFSAWMISLGWTRKKKAHELRKIFGSIVCQQAGLSAAQDLLGHSSPNTTKGYYVEAMELPRIKIFG